MKETLLILAAANAALAIPMALLVKRDFARLGRVSMFMATWTGGAMHGNAALVMALVFIDRGSLGATGIAMLATGGIVAASGASIIALGRKAYANFARVYGLKEDELIERGVYRWSRNPQYVGYVLFLAGVAVAGMSVLALGLAALFAVFIHYYIVGVEEPHLKNAFGDKYRAYMRCVPRYLGPPRGPNMMIAAPRSATAGPATATIFSNVIISPGLNVFTRGCQRRAVAARPRFECSGISNFRSCRRRKSAACEPGAYMMRLHAARRRAFLFCSAAVSRRRIRRVRAW